MSNLSWAFVYASVVGTSHQRRDVGCQDYSIVEYFKVEDRTNRPIVYAAVSDGAGTSRFGATGAELAVTIFRDEVFRELVHREGILSPEILKSAILKTSTHIEEHATRLGHPCRDYAATLVCVILMPEKSWLIQIGDGAAVFGKNDGRWVQHWPDNGEYANETFFITDDNVLDITHIEEIDCPDEVTLLTDGLQPIALNLTAKEVHDPFFTSFYRVLKTRGEGYHEDLARSLALWMQTDLVNDRTDDDKSLVLINRTKSDVDHVVK
jgi:hypothetical protein